MFLAVNLRVDLFVKQLRLLVRYESLSYTVRLSITLNLNYEQLFIQLRYQKCLDAHPNHPGSQSSGDSPNSTKGLGATIKNFVTSFALKKDKSSS